MIKKIISGDTVSIIKDGAVTMLQCGEGHNKNLLDFLDNCEDDAVLTKITMPHYQNFVRRYGQMPEAGVEIFDYGLRVNYIYVNRDYETPLRETENGSVEYTSAFFMGKVPEIVCGQLSETEEEAADRYKRMAGQEPDYLIKCCKDTRIVSSMINLETLEEDNLIKGDIIRV